MKGLKKYVLFYIFFIVGIISCFFIRNTYFVWFIVLSILLVPTFFVFEKLRVKDNIFVYYIIKGPLFLMFVLLVFSWFFFPVFYYFSEPSSIYYTFCLQLLGGELGKIIWIGIYLFGWSYVGWKIIDRIERMIIGFINKFKKNKF
jgi:hypothetical protein